MDMDRKERIESEYRSSSMPRIYMAPLEGITTHVYRKISRQFFREPDKYFTPYLSPADHELFSVREREEIDPLANDVTKVVPQLMVNRADLCLDAIREFRELGYREVNLNMGCPSGNVVRKGKGSGMLRDLDRLDHFLDVLFEDSTLPVSVKTRLGLQNVGEFSEILKVLRKYPFSEMILHPRVRDQFYQGKVYFEQFRMAQEICPYPVVYNGEIRTREQIRNWRSGDMMIGRGLIAHPDLLEPEEVSEERVREFLNCLEEAYLRVLPGEGPVLVRMKRIWNCRLDVMEIGREKRIRLMQSQTLKEFHGKLMDVELI